MKRARLVAALAAFGSCTALAAWWLSAPPANVKSAVRTASEAVEEQSREPRAELATPGASPTSPSAAPRELVSAQPDALPATPPAPDLRGSLVVVEADGTENTLATGSLALTSWVDVTPRHHEVNVVNGAWTLPGDLLRGATALSFRSVQLGVQGAAIEAPIGLVRKPFGDELAVRARALSSASLRVLAADTGLELQHVTLLSTGPFDTEERHPGFGYEPRILARDLRSPIVLEDPIFPRRRFGKAPAAHVLVGAPLYAWTNAEIGLEAGGEHVVMLAPGADLAIDVFGCSPEQHSFLRVRRSEDFLEPCVELALRSDGRYVLNGLPAGAYRIAGEVDANERLHRSLVLGMVVAQLHAGERTEARLELSAAPSMRAAAASGVVYLPKSWRATQLRLALVLLDEPLQGFERTHVFSTSPATSQREGFDAFAWSQDQLQVGSYLLGSEDPVDATVIDVPPGGRAGLEWVFAPPAELLVHVVDDATGNPLDVEAVWWRVPAFEPRPVGGLATREGPGTYRIRAPARVVSIQAKHASYEPGAETVDVRSTHDVTLRLKQTQGFTVRLMEGAFPADPEAIGSFLFLGSLDVDPDKVVAVDESDSGFKVRVSEPGTYRLRLSVIPGFKPVPDQRIEVFAGSFTAHVISLVRSE